MHNKANRNSEKGFMLISVIVLMALTLLVAAGLVSTKTTEAKIRSTTNEQVRSYRTVEDTMSKTVAWLQANSPNLVNAFTATNFAANFDITAPSVGTNESANFSVPTLVKMKATNNSVMLSNNALFGTSAFPNTTNITTGVAFNAVNAFQAADLGEANTRIVLVWARNTDGNYQPVFRVDTITNNSPDRGVHSFTYVYSSLVSNAGVGFYTSLGNITLSTGNNSCNSHNWTYNAGSWSSGANRENCNMASDLGISTAANIGGNVSAKLNVAVNGPGGDVSGTTCKNNLFCHSITNLDFDLYVLTCLFNQGNLTVNSNTTLSVPGNGALQKCWRDVTVSPGVTLTLNTTAYPYHFRNLTLQGNAKIAIAPLTAGQYVNLNVDSINGNSINGDSWINPNAPHQFKLDITGGNNLTLNGNGSFKGAINAPLIAVNLSGNFNFYGGIKARAITASGNARLFADEAISGPPTITGLNFTQTKASQRYRLF